MNPKTDPLRQRSPCLRHGTWAIAALTLTVAQSGAADWERYFDTIDRNGDGRISRDELAAFPALARYFDASDRDGSGLLDAEEFRRLIAMPTQEVPQD